jgi:hypothetical protein
MTDQITSNDDRVADDILRGAIEIGDELNLKPEAVYYLYAKQERAKRKGNVTEEQYPITKLGKVLIASRRGLRRAHHRITST